MPTIWSRDTESADTLFWQLSINHNMDVQYQRSIYGNGATLLFLKVWGLAHGRTTYGQQKFLDRWVTKFSEVGLRSFVFGAQELRYYTLKKQVGELLLVHASELIAQTTLFVMWTWVRTIGCV